MLGEIILIRNTGLSVALGSATDEPRYILSGSVRAYVRFHGLSSPLPAVDLTWPLHGNGPKGSGRKFRISVRDARGPRFLRFPHHFCPC